MSKQFILIGSFGTFSAPLGESRIGSDAACQICIHGEGILPVHAYLHIDDAKLLLCPAAISSNSSVSGAAAITIDGQRLEGPTILTDDQVFFIGNERLQLKIKSPRLWSRRWFKRLTYISGAVAALLLISYLFLIFVLLEPGRLKAKVINVIAAQLLRDETDIDFARVDLFHGALELKAIKIKERANFATASTASTPFIKIASLTAQMSPWQMLGFCVSLPRGWFSELTNLQITITEPEVVILRSKTDGAFSIEDIVAKYRRYKADLGVNKLSFQLEIKNGVVRLRDDFISNIGETSLENINILLRQPLDEPLAIERCEMRANAIPALTSPGQLAISGHIHVMNDECFLDISKLSSDDLKLEMRNFDLARVFEHFGYAWEPYNANLKVVLGKPITGQVNLKLIDARRIHVYGVIKSDSLLSIKEENRPLLGNIPMKLEYDVKLTDNGNGYRPYGLDIKLRSGDNVDDPRSLYLICGAIGQFNPSGASDYSVYLQRCDLEKLVGTDVGRRLGLDGCLGGQLEGSARVRLDVHGRLIMDAKLASNNSFVMIADTSENLKSPQPNLLTRQPLPIRFDCHASAQPNTSGGISYIDIESFSFSAPSIEAKSTVRGVIRGLSSAEKLEAHAQFQLNLKGREFWNEFAPILNLFGFKRPVQETLNLTVTIDGKDDLVSIAAKGTAARQWGNSASPVELLSLIDYNAKLARSRAQNSPPYLTLILHIAATKGKPLNVRIQANCSRNNKIETIVLEGHGNDHAAPLLINSDIATLRERFQPYIQDYLQSLDGGESSQNNLLALYRDTQLAGELEQSGRIVLERRLDCQSPEEDKVQFDLTISGKDLKIDLPLSDVKGSNDKIEKTRFVWSEPAPMFRLKGAYSQRLSQNKEEPSKERLNIEKLSVKGRLGEFCLDLADLDIFKLSHLRSLPNQSWTDVLSRLSITGQINPPAYDFLRALRVLAPDHPISGVLSLQAAFDREKDSLDLRKFIFRQTDHKREFFLLNLDVSGSLARLRDLTTRLAPVRESAPAFSENFLALLQESGPAELLDYLGENISINALQIETAPLMRWLIKNYKPQASERQPSSIIAKALNKDWQPEGTWKLYGIKLTRSDPKIRRWSLVGALLRTDLTCFGATALGAIERPPIFTFTHDWRLAMGLAVAADNCVALDGDIILDDAYLEAWLPQLDYKYLKPAKEACKLELNEIRYSHGVLAQIGRLKLSGKPINIELKDFEMRDFGAELAVPTRGSYSIGELLISGGPLPCAAIVHKYEPQADIINASLRIPKLDLPYLTKLVGWQKSLNDLEATGALNDINITYKGSILAALAMLESDRARLLARFPKIEPSDSRLFGLNPDTDKLEIDTQLDNVCLAFGATNNRQSAIQLGGQLRLTSRDLILKELTADINLHRLKAHYAFSAPTLRINSTDAKLNLMRALKSPGIPASINSQIVFSTPLDSDIILMGLSELLRKLGATDAPAAPGEKQLTPLEKLCVSGSFKTPLLNIEDATFVNLQANDYSLKDLKLSAPAIDTEIFGGKLAICDAEYDFSKARCAQVDGKMTLRGIQHKQRFEIRGVEAPLLFAGDKLNKKSYALDGRLDAIGNLKGADFVGADRLSWEGALKLKLSNLAVQPPRQKESQVKLAPWSTSFAIFGDPFCCAIAKIVGNDTLNISELSEDMRLDAPQRNLNSLLLTLQVYLSKTFGVETARMEFDTIEPIIAIRAGFAAFESLALIGKGDNANLNLQIRNLKLNLTSNTLADDSGEGVVIFPTMIPISAKKALCLDKWPLGPRDDFLNNLEKGKFPLRIFGRFAAPIVKLPWSELRDLSRRALFDADKIGDIETLNRARKYLLRVWGADIDSAATVADRGGAGLPRTISARDQDETILDNIVNLPQSLKHLTAKKVDKATLTPRESLEQLLFAELNSSKITPANK